jgi:FKBP-type peptidyl-prolyl cis-trans isomerase SlyD
MDQNPETHEQVKDDKVVSLEYTLKVDGDVVDSSEEREPITFIQGQGQIIPGLESQLYGMSIGESKNVVVSPTQGYGDLDNEAYAEVPRREFPPNIPLEKGVALAMQDESGETVHAYIDEVKKDTIRLNFNHPLAGKELHFSVTVTDLRDATTEELEHGHVHDGEDEDEDWDEDDEDMDDDDDGLEIVAEWEDDDEDEDADEDWEDDEEDEDDEV